MRLRFLEYERFAVIFLCSFSYMELYATDSEFSRHSPIFDFSRSKSDLATLKLTQLGFNSL